MTQLEASEHLEENIDTHYSDVPPKDNVHPSSDAASSALRVSEANPEVPKHCILSFGQLGTPTNGCKQSGCQYVKELYIYTLLTG